MLESGRRANRPSLVQAMMSGTNAKYEEDIRIMNELVDESECRIGRWFDVISFCPYLYRFSLAGS